MLWFHCTALMSFFKDSFSHFGTPERSFYCGPPKEGARSEDVGEQALMRGLDTAGPNVRLGAVPILQRAST